MFWNYFNNLKFCFSHNADFCSEEICISIFTFFLQDKFGTLQNDTFQLFNFVSRYFRIKLKIWNVLISKIEFCDMHFCCSKAFNFNLQILSIVEAFHQTSLKGAKTRCIHVISYFDNFPIISIFNFRSFLHLSDFNSPSNFSRLMLFSHDLQNAW